VTILNRAVAVMAIALLSGCASSSFVSSWKAPDAQPLELKGAKVAAVVMMRSEASRRTAEDALAREITARGAIGVPMYTVLPDADPAKEPQARAELEKLGFQGAVVMRPIRVDKEVVSTPTYIGPAYGTYWGGYYGMGWGRPWDFDVVRGGEIRTDTIVSIETLIYSLKQNKLVWGGQSRTTNPGNVDQLVKRLSSDVAKELQRQGLIPRT
jgi:hypothetical protein